MSTITVNPGSSIQAAVNSVGNGGTVLCADGTYTGGIDFSGKSGITVKPVNYVEGQAPAVILNGGRIGGGDHISIYGMIVQNALGMDLQQAAITTGADWLLQDCISQKNESVGISMSGPRSRAVRCKALHNGYLGWGCGTPDGSPFPGPTCIDCETAYNNLGLPNPTWKARIPAGHADQVKFINGLYYANPGFEGGGAKFCCADGLVLVRWLGHDNNGPGLWLDAWNKTATIDSPHCYRNYGLPDHSCDFMGAGIAVEISRGPTTITNAYCHNNDGHDFSIWESNNVTIRNSISGGSGLEVRDLGGDRAKAGMIDQNLLFDSIKFYGSGKIDYWDSLTPAVRQQRNIVERNLSFGNTGTPTWTPAGGTTPPPTPPPQPPSTGTTVKTVTDGAGNVWTLNNAGQLSLNGTLRTETNGVTDIVVVSGTLYQTATSGFWQWNGTGWTKVNAIPTAPPAPPPVPVPRTIVSISSPGADGRCVATFSDGGTQPLLATVVANVTTIVTLRPA